jgi:hypothetical protein
MLNMTKSWECVVAAPDRDPGLVYTIMSPINFLIPNTEDIFSLKPVRQMQSLTVMSQSKVFILLIVTSSLKDTVPRDFSPLVFFFKQCLLVPVSKPRNDNDCDFFRIFVEIYDFSGASPVSSKRLIIVVPYTGEKGWDAS